MSVKSNLKIRDGIKLLGQAGKYEIYTGQVKTVDQGKATMDVDIDTGVTVFDVRLRAVVTDATGMWVLPKVGSYVIIAQIEGGLEYVLLQASEIDKVFIDIGGKKLEMNNTGFVFNDGNNGGVPKVDPLVLKLNNLENDLNALKQVLSTTLNALLTPVNELGNGNPSALQVVLFTALTTYRGNPFQPTVAADLANTELTQ